MIKFGTNRCYSINDANGLKEYLLQDYIYVKSDQLNETNNEDDLKFHKLRTELSLEDYSKLSDEEKLEYVRIEKCDRDLIITNHINDVDKCVDEFVDNNKSNCRPAPTKDSPVIYNGKNMRFAQQIIVSPAPEDNVSPSELQEFVKEFITHSKSLEDYQSVAVIHTDHFTGLDENSGKKYNTERLETYGPDKNIVNAHIFMNCTSTNHVRVSQDGDRYINPIRSFHDGSTAKNHGYDTRQDLQLLEMKLALERGWIHTVQHNPEYLKIKEHVIDQIKNNQEFNKTQAAMVMVVEEKVSLVHKNIPLAIDQLSKNLSASNYNRLLDYETSKTVQKRETDKQLQPTRDQSELRRLWKENINNLPVLRDQLRTDIEDVINIKNPLSMQQYKEEMKKLGYEVFRYKGETYYTTDKKHIRTVPRISSNSIDTVNHKHLNQFTERRLKYEIKRSYRLDYERSHISQSQTF